MEVIICIDDTDNLESKGTGHLAEILRGDIEKSYHGTTTRITRHQLFVSPDIPYTSHNSTMCFKTELDLKYLNDLIIHAGRFLETMSAPGSDPGLCVAVTDHITDKDRLIKFGIDATKKVLTKKDAYNLASELNIHLSEHGGTGGGVIGALSGIGLRIYGNNGRFKGWLPVPDSHRKISAGELLKYYEVDEVLFENGTPVQNCEILTLGERIKTVLLGGKCVLPVRLIDGEMRPLTKEEIRKY